MLLRCEHLEPPMSQLGHSLQVRPDRLSTNVRFASIPTVNSGLRDLSRWARTRHCDVNFFTFLLTNQC